MASALVTGTSTGIGFETALALGRAGYTVYAGMRNPNRSPQLQDIINEEKLPISILTLDVDSDHSVGTAVSTIRARTGCVDVLVNNAGVERRGSIEELSIEDFKDTMETNYCGALRCIQGFLPAMRERRSGCIINVSSVAGRIACSPLAPYSASKFALEALSEALAQEVKQFNIRVAIIQPGIIDTPMARRIEAPPGESKYPQCRRFARMFEASLADPTPPSVVGEKIRDIIESDTWQLRHAVGASAEPFLGWRSTMTDQQWIEWGALDDKAWYERVQQDFGLDARPKAQSV